MIGPGTIRRLGRRRTLRVDLGAALNLVGTLIKYLSLAFVLPFGFAIGYGEPVWPFAVSGVATAAAGLALERLGEGRRQVGIREGFLVVSLTWLFAAFFVSLPYLLAGGSQLSNPLDAYFESMSGMTTTGATVLTDVEALERSLAIWRQFSQWLGGMGIIVLAIAVLPRLAVGGRQLMESELPGPEVEELAASIRDTARRLWLLYAGLSALLALTLASLGWAGVDPEMSPFEALAHTFTTMPTGGFSTRARSLEEFSAASQWVITLFMMLAGANFALHFRALHRKANPLRDEEFRLYLAFLLLGTLIVFLELLRSDLFPAGEAAVRHAALQVTSMMTTTGYASTDFNQWTGLAIFTLVVVMLIGGCAGSTGGAIKVVRHLLIGKMLLRELDQTVHREAIVPIRLNGHPVEERTLRAVLTFGVIYVGLFIVGALVLTIESARAGLDVTPFDAIAASATTLGNVGPALGFAGPMGSFEPFSPFAKGVMIFLMWAGRLEIVPVAVLLTRRYWRA